MKTWNRAYKVAFASALIGIALPFTTLAQENNSQSLDSESQKALEEAQTLLKNPSERNKALNSPESKKVDQQVQTLMGPDSQALYELSADVLATIVKESNGDMVKIQETMNALMKNPQAFATKLTPSQLTKLQELARRAEARKPAAATQK